EIQPSRDTTKTGRLWSPCVSPTLLGDHRSSKSHPAGTDAHRPHCRARLAADTDCVCRGQVVDVARPDPVGRDVKLAAHLDQVGAAATGRPRCTARSPWAVPTSSPSLRNPTASNRLTV